MSELVLHEAAASGDYHELESLLMMGRIDVNFKDAEFGDRTALHWAAAKGSSRIIDNRKPRESQTKTIIHFHLSYTVTFITDSRENSRCGNIFLICIECLPI